MDKKIDFLCNAIADAQELIRFIDTKTAVAITVLGAYVLAFFANADRIIEYSFGYSLCFWFSLSLFMVCITLCIAITVRIIKPTNNPAKNINFGNLKVPDLGFFLSPNEYFKDDFYPFYNSDSFKLNIDFEAYIKQITNSNEDNIIHSLTFELFKVSFIRNIKNDRFNKLLLLLAATTIIFFISYFLFTLETQQILNKIHTAQNCYINY